MLKTTRFLMRRMPPGVAVDPFGFALVAGYAIVSGKILIDIMVGVADPSIAALPFTFRVMVTWLLVLFAGSAAASSGMILTARHVSAGLVAQRFGFSLLGVAIVTYLTGIIDRIGWQWTNITLVTIVLQLAAIVYKVVMLQNALRLIQPRAREDVS